jgi:hypothetical protein
MSIRPISINDLPAGQEDAFAVALDRYTRSAWRAAKPDVPAAPAPEPADVALLREIRDELKARPRV